MPIAVPRPPPAQGVLGRTRVRRDVPGLRTKLAEEKAAKAAAKAAAKKASNEGIEVPVAVAGKLKGSWSTEFGDTMVIEQEQPAFKARFNLKDGRMVGDWTGNTMNGVWVQSSSKAKCSAAREGSLYWGRIRLVFSENTYTGSWSYCEKEPTTAMKAGKRM